jgi:hypothetical protein
MVFPIPDRELAEMLKRCRAENPRDTLAGIQVLQLRLGESVDFLDETSGAVNTGLRTWKKRDGRKGDRSDKRVGVTRWRERGQSALKLCSFCDRLML